MQEHFPFSQLCGHWAKFELFNVAIDMDCLNNLSGLSEFKTIEEELKQVLFDELKRTNDTRVSETDFDIFDSYIRYSPMRSYPEPAE